MHLDAETGNSSNTVPSSQPEDGEFFGEVGDVKEPCAPATTNFVHLRGRGGADGLTKFQAKAG